MAKLKYKISARATILLGREGVSKADGAMVELIKNTYDADADVCFLCFDNSENLIYLYDNGSGMDQDTIANCWMLIGTANKKKDYVSSKNNRIKSGEKGIGRFALDRLGSKCTMFTKSINTNKMLKWQTDWSEFENTEKMLDQMEADIDEIDQDFQSILPEKFRANIDAFVEKENLKRKSINVNLIDPYKSGTLFVIGNLRDEWQDDEKKKFIDGLITLIPPSEQASFYIGIMDSLDSDSQIIFNPVSEEYDYKIKARFEDGIFNVNLYRNEFDLKAIPKEVFEMEDFLKEPYRYEDFGKDVFKLKYSISELMKTKDEKLIENVRRLGNFKFDYVFMKVTLRDDSKETFYYKQISRKRKKWLEEYGGIKIYRDNFFVRPYGDPTSESFDWLALEERHAKNPEGVADKRSNWHVRNRQSQGTVFISRVDNYQLLDKANREGIIENEYFTTFKNVLLAIISIFEKDRAYIARALKSYTENKDEKEKTKSEAREIAKRMQAENEEQEAKQKIKNNNSEQNKNDAEGDASKDEEKEKLATAVRYYEEEREDLLSELQQLRAIATNGLLTSTIAHDLKGLRAQLVSRVDTLEYLMKANKTELLNRSIKDLKDNDAFLKDWLFVITEQTRKDKRQRKKGDICLTVKKVVTSMSTILARKKVDIIIAECSENIERRIFEADFESIFYNLIINSIEAFEKAAREKRVIDIIFQTDDDWIIINYRDNGCGLEGLFDNPYDVFRLGVTSKKDKTGSDIGTGMGMYIVASTLREYNSSYELTEIVNGFGLNIKIPKGVLR